MSIVKNNQFLCVCWSFFLIIVSAQPAYADQLDTLNFSAGVSSLYDNNIFRADTNEESERTTSMYAGVRLEKQYSLQRFRLDAKVTNFKHQNNDFLDFTSKNFDTSWYWSLTPRLTGTISADRSESLNNYNDFRNTTVRNTRVVQNQLFQADFAPGGGWHFLAGVSRKTLKNSEEFVQEANFSSNSLDVGAKYAFKSGSSITMMNHVRKGSFDDRQINQAALLDNRYKEQEYEVRLNWLITAKSQLNFITSYLNREHDNFSKRDYSGLQGGLAYSWAPTAKIKLLVSANSRLSTFQSSTSSYTRTNSLTISPSYEMTDKIRLRASLGISERNFEGDGVVQSNGRVDDVRTASIGVDWSPTNYLTLGLSVQQINQDSNVDGFEYDDTTASVSANLMF